MQRHQKKRQEQGGSSELQTEEAGADPGAADQVEDCHREKREGEARTFQASATLSRGDTEVETIVRISSTIFQQR